MTSKFLKRCWTLIFLIVPQIISGQYSNLKLDENQLFYEKVYQVDSIPFPEMERFVFDGVSKINGLTNIVKTEGMLVAKLTDIYIDYRKYGGKWANTAAYLNHPFNADISIVWKDGRYKVTANNMLFRTGSSAFGDVKCLVILVSDGQFKTNKLITTSGKYIEQYLSEIFLIKRRNENW